MRSSQYNQSPLTQAQFLHIEKVTESYSYFWISGKLTARSQMTKLKTITKYALYETQHITRQGSPSSASSIVPKLTMVSSWHINGLWK